jgi:Ca2+-binding RTX toxin-like protein
LTYSITDDHGGSGTASVRLYVANRLGDSGDNTLNGTGTDDTLAGLAGNDTLDGKNGNDILIGGVGNDSLTGGAGVDTFVWNLADKSSGSAFVDTVTDFNAAGGDKLDLSDLLQNENSGNLTQYLHFEQQGGNTLISISSSGGFSDGNYPAGLIDQQIILTGVSLSGTDADIITQLKNDGNLITD